MRLRRRHPLLRRPKVLVPAVLCCVLPLAACGADDRPAPVAPSADEQVRDAAKGLARDYAGEDYRGLCARFAPGTFNEVLASLELKSCEALFRNAPTFEAPSPQQIDAARVRVHRGRATIVFREQGVDPMFLEQIRGRWLIVNEAEVTDD